MSLSVSSWIIACAVVSVPAVLALRRKLQPSPIPGVPHHPIKSWLGDLPSLASDIAKYGEPFADGAFFHRSAEELGPIYQVLVGPFHKIVFISDVQEIEDVLLRNRSKSLDLGEAQRAKWHNLFQEGMITLKTDDQWRRHRRVTMPFMSSTYLNQLTPAITASANCLVEYWERKTAAIASKGGVCFSCGDDISMAALDVISEVVTGESLALVPDALDQLAGVVPVIDSDKGATFAVKSSPLVASFRYVISSVSSDSMPLWITWIMVFMWSIWPPFIIAYARFKAYVDRCAARSRAAIKEAKSLGEDRTGQPCMISAILEKEDSEGVEQFTEGELRDEVLTFMLGGLDTVSHTMQFGVKFLTDAPDVQRTLHSELRLALEDSLDQKSLSYTELMSGKLPYLEAVTAEVLRCARVAEGSERITTAPIDVLGCRLPADTDVVFLAPLAGQMRTKSNLDRIGALDNVRSDSSIKNGSGGRNPWDGNGMNFDPSRWIVIDEVTGAKKFDPKAGYSYPFGLGIRSCAGKQLAQLELKVLISTINLAFFLDKVPEAFATYRSALRVTKSPLKAYIAPKAWNDVLSS